MDIQPAGKYTIRPAERRDCNAIAGLIKELAIYEKMPDQAKMTGLDLERDAFDSNPPYFRSFIAEVTDDDDAEKGVVVGYGLYVFHYSTWEGKMVYLEDFYITPAHRHGGLGSKMLKYLAKYCDDNGFVRLKFECLNWNESAIKFYKKHNATNLTETEGWNSFRYGKDAIHSLATMMEEDEKKK